MSEGIHATNIGNDLRAIRVTNLLLQSGVTKAQLAPFLRKLADFYEPSGERLCDVCETFFRPNRRTHVHCSAACCAAAYRRRHASRRMTKARSADAIIALGNGQGARRAER